MSLAQHWDLDPSITYLNHGSFGACPRVVLGAQHALQQRLEREPVRFLSRELENLLDAARLPIASFLGADPQDLVFVPNATTGVNTVLASFPFVEGDEVIVTDHGYNACNNAAVFWAGRHGARVRMASVPFPCPGPAAVLDAILNQVSPYTRLLLVDHVTSPTGMVFPLAELVREMRSRQIRVLVDGAHAPGMIELWLSDIDADYYTGNFHKWCCSPKGAAFLYVRRELQPEVRPLVISHGANSQRNDRSRFLLEFDWTGTFDPTAPLSVPTALACLAEWVPGGWPGVRAKNHALAVLARLTLAESLEVPLPCPDSMLGSLATLPLPNAELPSGATVDPLHTALFERHRIEAPVFFWPERPRRYLRVAAHLYNDLSQYQELGRVLRESPETSGNW